VTADPLLYETHMHTPLCGHASGQPEEYARVAVDRGLKGVVVTCHNPLPKPLSPRVRMRIDQFDGYVKMVDRARAAMVGLADVRLGMECDYIPGLEGWLEQQLGWADFDYVLGSVHPHLAEYRDLFWGGDIDAYQRGYFEHLAMSAETGLFDALAHPDLIKTIESSEWRPERLAHEIERALDRIARTGVAMEFNTSGRYKVPGEMYPAEPILVGMAARGIPVVIGADAHAPERVADGYGGALERLARAGYDEVSLFLRRRRVAVPLEQAWRQVEQANSEIRGALP